MLQTQHTIQIPPVSSHTESIFTENSLLFDIETTGFSAKYETVYLIGYAVRGDCQLTICQLFAESPSEEPLLLSAFLEILSDAPVLISYNGDGFDIPFLKQRCQHHGIKEAFDDCTSMDLMKYIRKTKSITNLTDCKQKSVEQFLGLSREDLYSGGELIKVYKEYVKEPDDEALALLYLHNYEDVLHMMDLLPMLAYNSLGTGSFTIQRVICQPYLDLNQNPGEELLFQLQFPFEVPVSCTLHHDRIHASLKRNLLYITIPLLSDTLRFYFSDYKNYYYLPDEDTVIHKSLALFVDKDHRQKAKAADCYTRQQGTFLMLPPDFTCDQPVFVKEYKDKISYVEYNEDLLSDSDFLFHYAKKMVQLLLK